MVEIPLNEYLEMANQAYVVAYVTGFVNLTPPIVQCSQPSPCSCLRDDSLV